jgi:hypothetical protein
MKPPYRLVPDAVSGDTVKALQQLLAEAKKGQVIGVAFVAMYKQRQFIANAAGEAKRSPVFTRGMVACLDDVLARQADNPL